jgi:hypothetical protein
MRAERSDVRAVSAPRAAACGPAAIASPSRRMAALWAAAALCAAAGPARADCPADTPQAACVLHEEGVKLLTASRHGAAAAKFRAAIAAHPSARSYLGYSQALEGQDKLALAYDTMLEAKRLSDEELEDDGAKDPAKIGRAERIKYKLGELRGKIGLVSLRLPEGVAEDRLVAVRREGEGDLASPLERPIAVEPDRQVLIATLDDGKQISIVAEVEAGTKTSLVIPIAGQPARDRPSKPPSEEPRPPTPLPRTALGMGVSFSTPGPELPFEGPSLKSGLGLFAFAERRVARLAGLSFRFDYVNHAGSDMIVETVSGYEVMLLGGVRTMTRVVHARLEAGVTISKVESRIPFDDTYMSWTDLNLLLGLGGGLQLGRARLHASILYSPHLSGEDRPEIPIRLLLSAGFDFWRSR